MWIYIYIYIFWGSRRYEKVVLRIGLHELEILRESIKNLKFNFSRFSHRGLLHTAYLILSFTLS